MSSYTTEVRYICETAYGLQKSEGSSKIEEILDDVADKVLDFDFPIFDENYRKPLKKKILRHFYTREIGAETVGLWKLWVNDVLNLEMPYLNRLYAMYALEFNPLYNFSMERKHEAKGKRTANDRNDFHNDGDFSSNNTSNDLHMYSDTPQNGIDDVQTGKYLTNASADSSTGNSNGENHSGGWSTNSGTVDDESNYVETVQGFQGIVVGEAYKKFLEGLRNVDMMLMEKLEGCFMQLW